MKANSLSVNWLTAKTWDKYTVLPSFSYAGTFGGDSPVQSLQSLGGFFNLSGYMPDEISGQYSGLARLTPFIAIWVFTDWANSMPNSIWDFLLRQGMSGRTAPISPQDRLSMQEAFLSGPVLSIGPVYLIYGLAEGGHQALGLLIGQRF